MNSLLVFLPGTHSMRLCDSSRRVFSKSNLRSQLKVLQRWVSLQSHNLCTNRRPPRIYSSVAADRGSRRVFVLLASRMDSAENCESPFDCFVRFSVRMMWAKVEIQLKRGSLCCFRHAQKFIDARLKVVILISSSMDCSVQPIERHLHSKLRGDYAINSISEMHFSCDCSRWRSFPVKRHSSRII